MYLEPSQTSKMELSAKIVNGWKMLIIFTNCFILNDCKVLNTPMAIVYLLQYNLINRFLSELMVAYKSTKRKEAINQYESRPKVFWRFQGGYKIGLKWLNVNLAHNIFFSHGKINEITHWNTTRLTFPASLALSVTWRTLRSVKSLKNHHNLFEKRQHPQIFQQPKTKWQTKYHEKKDRCLT